MKTQSSIRGMEVSMTCPRKAFILSEIPGNVQKYRLLSKVFKSIIEALPVTATKMEVANQINLEFSLSTLNLLPFEERAEKVKMHKLIMRYFAWEQTAHVVRDLDKDFKVVVQFSGEDTQVSVDRLVDRGGFYEAINYAYKIPDLKNNGRRLTTQKTKSIRLLMLYLAGKKKLEQLQAQYGTANYPNKPVYGAIYYMRSARDTAKFEEFNHADDQIISHSFTNLEIRDIELIYSKVKVSPNSTSCNPSDCFGCPCNDLCQTNFVPKKEIKLPPPEIKPINEIHLTPSQEAFIDFRKGEARVNAVAGSGKTTIITLRTICLLEEGVKPEEIWMVTFTDKACGEMRERIRRYMAGSALNNLKLDIDKLTISTFNSWGQMLLTAHYDKLGFTAPPVVIDDIQKKDIIIKLLETHNKLPLHYADPFMDTKNAKGAVIEMGQLIDMMKASDVKTVAETESLFKISDKFRRYAAEFLQVYQEYNAQLLDKNLIDYEDQLRLLLVLNKFGVFKSLPYKHIIVDEFQDTNDNQINLLREIMTANPGIESLAVVGDEMQAIYGFRNASPENLIEFNKYFPQMQDYYLSENFRSQAPIIAMANTILAKEARIKQAIKAQRTTSQVDPLIIYKDDREDEVAFIVKAVQAWIDDGLKPSSIAILGRSRSELAKYEKALNKEHIDTILRVPEILKDNAFVKGILAFAKWINDPTQIISFALYAKMIGQDPFDIPNLKAGEEKIRKAFEDAASDKEKTGLFYSFIEPAREDYIADFFIKSLENKAFTTFKQLIEYCVKYQTYGIKEEHSTAKEESEAVTLITVHSAKGLEYDNVITSLRPYRESAEEKRILYVAVTRARERLIITTTQKQPLNRLIE